MARRVLFVYGTRPEAIKMAPLVLALRRQPEFEPVVAVTGQHREMLDQVLDLFGIVPDVDLAIQQPRQSLSGIAARALAGLDPVLEATRPDLVMVQGDTTTTLAATLAAFHRDVPVAHVEAGLRTGDRRSPFPEEMNRRLTSQLADLHLAPTPTSVANLVAEGIRRAQVVCTGNPVIDALDYVLAQPSRPLAGPALAGLEADPRRVLLVTLHRRESFGEPMARVGRALARLADQRPDLAVVVPLHLNPAVRDVVLPLIAGRPGIVVVPPLDYGSFARLLDRADVVLTDSGGIQEEAPSRGKPVLVLRDTTERPEAVAAGTVALVGTDEQRIVAEVGRLLDDPDAYRAMARAVNPYGDGRAAPRTVGALRWFFGLGERPGEFTAEAASAAPPQMASLEGAHR